MFSTEPLSFFLGHDQFIWWIGEVKDVHDTLKVGRVKVRIIGVHTEDLSTNELPWAYPLMPVTHSTMPHTLKPKDWVAGFFLDSKLCQLPVIWGVFPSIPQATANT